MDEVSARGAGAELSALLAHRRKRMSIDEGTLLSTPTRGDGDQASDSSASAPPSMSTPQRRHTVATTPSPGATPQAAGGGQDLPPGEQEECMTLREVVTKIRRDSQVHAQEGHGRDGDSEKGGATPPSPDRPSLVQDKNHADARPGNEEAEADAAEDEPTDSVPEQFSNDGRPEPHPHNESTFRATKSPVSVLFQAVDSPRRKLRAPPPGTPVGTPRGAVSPVDRLFSEVAHSEAQSEGGAEPWRSTSVPLKALSDVLVRDHALARSIGLPSSVCREETSLEVLGKLLCCDGIGVTPAEEERLSEGGLTTFSDFSAKVELREERRKSVLQLAPDAALVVEARGSFAVPSLLAKGSSSASS